MNILTCEVIARTALGEPVHREGVELLWRCGHPERHKNRDAHPSLKVNSHKNAWGCFVCGVGGTAWQLAAFLAGLHANDKAGVAAWLKARGLLNGSKQSAKPPNGQGPRVKITKRRTKRI